MFIPIVGFQMLAKVFMVEGLRWQLGLHKEIIFIVAAVGKRGCVGEDGISPLGRVPT